MSVNKANGYLRVAKIIFQEGTSTKSIRDILIENGYIVHEDDYGYVSDYCKRSVRCNETCEGCDTALSLISLEGRS